MSRHWTLAYICTNLTYFLVGLLLFCDLVSAAYYYPNNPVLMVRFRKPAGVRYYQPPSQRTYSTYGNSWNSPTKSPPTLSYPDYPQNQNSWSSPSSSTYGNGYQKSGYNTGYSSYGTYPSYSQAYVPPPPTPPLYGGLSGLAQIPYGPNPGYYPSFSVPTPALTPHFAQNPPGFNTDQWGNLYAGIPKVAAVYLSCDDCHG